MLSEYYTSEFSFNSSRQHPFGLIISPNASGGAHGELFWDDGVSIGRYALTKNIRECVPLPEHHMKPD